LQKGLTETALATLGCFNIFCSDTSAVLTLYILIMLQAGV